MRKLIKDFWIAGMATFIILGCFNIACANDGPKVLKVKGLYLGMPIKEATDLAAKLVGPLDKNKCSEQKIDKETFIYSCSRQYNDKDLKRHTRILFVAKNNKVTSFQFLFANELFGVEGWSFDKFVQTFIDTYKIPSMKGKRIGRSETEYSFESTKYGYKVVMDSAVNIIIEKIATEKSGKFD